MEKKKEILDNADKLCNDTAVKRNLNVEDLFHVVKKRE